MTPTEGVTAFPNGDNMFEWSATLIGPAGTVYEALTYKLKIVFTSEYPYKAPKVSFVTSCFHPNVDAPSGEICLDILKDKWSALYTVNTILVSIRSLLGDPNPDSPLNIHAAELWACQDRYKEYLLKDYQSKVGPLPQ
mmetsp:Transcript_2457/g.2743  ORF Transcript_2457/g.2743 Transcript_2457/m.2743 type:complete len:138 (+) Transcript_2457:2-415(+)